MKSPPIHIVVDAEGMTTVSLLHPEAYGWTVSPEVARHARRVLGMEAAS